MIRLVLCCIALVGLLFSTNSMAQTAAKAKKLPNFSFYDLEGNPYTAGQVKYDQYLTVVYFDPGCEHCVAMTEAIAKNWSKFAKTKMIWVSISDAQPIEDFQNHYFPNKKNIIFLQDKDMKVFDYFDNMDDTPTVKIYDKNRNQVAHFGPDTPVSKIYGVYK